MPVIFWVSVPNSISLAKSARSFAPASSPLSTVKVPPAANVAPLSSSTRSKYVCAPTVRTVTGRPPAAPITVF